MNEPGATPIRWFSFSSVFLALCFALTCFALSAFWLACSLLSACFQLPFSLRSAVLCFDVLCFTLICFAFNYVLILFHHMVVFSRCQICISCAPFYG